MARKGLFGLFNSLASAAAGEPAPSGPLHDEVVAFVRKVKEKFPSDWDTFDKQEAVDTRMGKARVFFQKEGLAPVDKGLLSDAYHYLARQSIELEKDDFHESLQSFQETLEAGPPEGERKVFWLEKHLQIVEKALAQRIPDEPDGLEGRPVGIHYRQEDKVFLETKRTELQGMLDTAKQEAADAACDALITKINTPFEAGTSLREQVARIENYYKEGQDLISDPAVSRGAVEKLSVVAMGVTKRFTQIERDYRDELKQEIEAFARIVAEGPPEGADLKAQIAWVMARNADAAYFITMTPIEPRTEDIERLQTTQQDLMARLTPLMQQKHGAIQQHGQDIKQELGQITGRDSDTSTAQASDDSTPTPS